MVIPKPAKENIFWSSLEGEIPPPKKQWKSLLQLTFQSVSSEIYVIEMFLSIFKNVAFGKIIL